MSKLREQLEPAIRALEEQMEGGATAYGIVVDSPELGVTLLGGPNEEQVYWAIDVIHASIYSDEEPEVKHVLH